MSCCDSESHLAIHTWPELGYAAVDVLPAGRRLIPGNACNYMAEKFGAGYVNASEVKRGIIEQEERMVVNI